MNDDLQERIKKLVEALRDSRTEENAMLDVLSARAASLHLCAQHTAFFLLKCPNEDAKEKYLQGFFKDLSQLILDYEKAIRKTNKQ